jgi:hypothetical protein
VREVSLPVEDEERFELFYHAWVKLDKQKGKPPHVRARHEGVL